VSEKGPKLIYGDLAHTLLRDEKFLELWRNLHESCPQATVCQTPEFVGAWYEEYRDQWNPVILYSHNLTGDLTGLFLLAYNPSTQALTHAGDHQSEYHTWLTLPGEDSAFLARAWSQLTQRFSFATLRFRYLPGSELGDTLKSVPNIRSKVIVRRRSRPLMKIDHDDVKASFAKKGNKRRFNRLKKLGKLEFRRITDPLEHERVFNELISFYDFRQGAVYHTTSFRKDPNKRAFYNRIFKADPTKVHVSVTYLNEKPIAGLWGLINGNAVSIAMIMHSPFLTEHSPGKLHIMQLSHSLLEEGKEVLDITPGGAPWKERFANAHDEVADAVIYRTALARFRAEMLYEFMQWVKRNSARVGVTTTDMKSTLSTLRRARPSAVMRKTRKWIREDCEIRINRIERCFATSFARDERVHCNSLNDLLSSERDEDYQSRGGFLSCALARLENGELVYTINVENRLAHYGWMTGNKAHYLNEVKQWMTVPPGSLIFYDFETLPEFSGQGLYRATLSHMLHEAFAQQVTRYVYIPVPAHNMPARHVIETMGFEYQGSYFFERHFGAERKWASAMISEADVIDA
jgi:CelD/BcsL family acetyltransferase involved in cellulose biosynthesis/RimJ/RimL family protein N-acetyltransferase